MSRWTRFTVKQVWLLETIFRGAPSGGFWDMDALHKALPWTCTKQALQCSIRVLEGRGMILRDREMRGSRWHAIIKLSPVGEKFFDRHSGTFDTIAEGFDPEDDLDLTL